MSTKVRRCCWAPRCTLRSLTEDSMTHQEWRPGEVVVDLYEVLEVIRTGGMGLVYRVRHRDWNVDLAVEVPRPELIKSTQGRRGFEKEAESWVGFGLHPHTVNCDGVLVDSGSMSARRAGSVSAERRVAAPLTGFEGQPCSVLDQRPSGGTQLSSSRNSPGLIPACRRIEARVPRLMVLCSGMTTVRPSGCR